MIKSKIIYLILFIVSVIFFILYSKPLSLYLMLFIVALPFILGFFIILAKKFINGDTELYSDTAIKNEKINISVRIRNKTPIPFTNSIVKIEYYNTLVNIRDTMIVSIPIHAMCSEKINISLTSDYCGILEIKIRSIQVFDFIKLFSCRIKPDNMSRITVLPEIYPINSVSSFSLINSDDSDIFSKYKSGDDPSEIFVLKDYVPGDKPNRIHWNLSLMHDEIIVRHYSQPVNSSILLILDFCGASGRDANALDTAAETAFSISFFLADNDIPFKFVYYSKTIQRDVTEDISDEKDIVHVLREIFNEGPAEKTVFRMNELIQGHSGIFYITTSGENLYDALNLVGSEGFRPIYIENEYEDANKFEKYNEITVIPAGKSKQFISDILI